MSKASEHANERPFVKVPLDTEEDLPTWVQDSDANSVPWGLGTGASLEDLPVPSVNRKEKLPGRRTQIKQGQVGRPRFTTSQR